MKTTWQERLKLYTQDRNQERIDELKRLTSIAGVDL
jgi:hypothetical protein